MATKDETTIAIQKFRAVMAREPNYPRTTLAVFPYIERRMFRDALARVESSRATTADEPWFWAETAYVQGRWNNQDEARTALEKLTRMSRAHPVEPGALAMAYIGIGDRQEAIAWLEKAYVQHSTVMTTLRVDPMYDQLRGQPEFQELLRRVGLGP